MNDRITNLADWRAEHHGTLSPTEHSLEAAGNWTAPATATALNITETYTFSGTGQTTAHVEVVVSEDGPWVTWRGENPDELRVMALALMDAARAARNGDDLNEVARQEWHRRGGRPEPD